MTVHVPGVAVITRKPRWKQLLLPEIPATRLACLTSGSFRPKLGLGILFLLILGCIILVLVPLIITPSLSSLLVTSRASSVIMEFNKKAVEAVAKANSKFDNKLYQILVYIWNPYPNSDSQVTLYSNIYYSKITHGTILITLKSLILLPNF